MNKSRRKQIENIQSRILDLKDELETVRNEEQEAYDNLPESFQDGEKGEKMNNALENLDYAYSSLEEIEEYLEEAIQ